jgi:hypothetical protein
LIQKELKGSRHAGFRLRLNKADENCPLLRRASEIIFALQEKNSSPSARQTAFPVLFLLDNFRAAIFIGRLKSKETAFMIIRVS